MAAQVYTFRITYRECEDRIWRTAAVSSNYTLAQLGYMVLATFATMAYHSFDMTHNGTTYLLTQEDLDEMLDFGDENCDLLGLHKIGALGLCVGDVIEMMYDPGCGQEFTIELVSIDPMPRGHGTSYPKILDGAGRGIVDDLPAFELLEAMHRIDETGHSDIYYSPIGSENAPEWDYRQYDIKDDNGVLKGMIATIREAYEYLDE